jgi:hypothetical protein
MSSWLSGGVARLKCIPFCRRDEEPARGSSWLRYATKRCGRIQVQRQQISYLLASSKAVANLAISSSPTFVVNTETIRTLLSVSSTMPTS